MLVARPGEPAVLLDFFVEAPGRGADHTRAGRARAGRRVVRRRAPGLQRRPGLGRRLRNARRDLRRGARFGTLPLSELAAPAAALARDGVEVNAQQAYVVRDPRRDRARDARGPRGARAARGPCCRRATVVNAASSATRSSGSGARAPSRSTGRHRGGGGRLLRAGRRDAHRRGPRGLRGRRARAGARRLPRARRADQPAAVGGRHADRLCARAARAQRAAAPPDAERLVAAMEAAQAARTPEFLEGLAEDGLRRVASSPHGSGSTTHISVMDAAGWACGVTCSNGEGVGDHRAGHRHSAEQHDGRAGPQSARLPPAPAGPADAEHDVPDDRARSRRRRPRSCSGAAGSNRIRSAILQTIVGVVDRGLDVRRGGRRAARARRGRRRLRRAGHRTRDARARGRSDLAGSATATCSSAACRPWSATPRPVRCRARATRGGAGRW